MHKFIPRNKNPHLIFVILVFDLRILGFEFGFSMFVGFCGFFGGACGYVEGCWWWRLWLWISGFAVNGGGAGFRCSWVLMREMGFWEKRC